MALYRFCRATAAADKSTGDTWRSKLSPPMSSDKVQMLLVSLCFHYRGWNRDIMVQIEMIIGTQVLSNRAG
jgi:hypothetical protein